jgi:DNA-directed RNA polymerase specialized sigma24 family protein
MRDRGRIPHSKADVEKAIKHLTPADLMRIRKYAEFLITKGSGRQYEWEDLVSEAYLRTWEGKRNWVIRQDGSSVTFAEYLIGAMRSIAYSWKKQPTNTAERLEDVEGLLTPVLDQPNLAKQRLESFVEASPLDAESRRFLAAMVKEGADPQEVKRKYGMTSFNIMRRIRRISSRFQWN